MTRKQTIEMLHRVARKIADAKGLDIVTVRDSTNGVWDMPELTGCTTTYAQILAVRYGEKLVETHFTAVPYEKYDLHEDFKVSVEFRFANPRICVGTQWGEDGFASVEYGPADRENDTDYELSEITIFRESGQKYYRQLMAMIKEEKKNI